MNVGELPSHLRWSSAWLDLLAFAVGLGSAWLFNWNATDLVWSLWLSSLVIGYAMIVWSVTGPMREIAAGMAGDSADTSLAARAGVLSIVGVGTLFGLAFFTVHFGGFHYVHSAFLSQFFPIAPKPARGFVSFGTYAEVFRRYWWFLPAAALAERGAFRRKPALDATSVTPEAIKARMTAGNSMTEPYRNVAKMHMLIFFFFFAYFAHLANFAVYAVAYAVYFFPWRLVRRNTPAIASFPTSQS